MERPLRLAFHALSIPLSAQHKVANIMQLSRCRESFSASLILLNYNFDGVIDDTVATGNNLQASGHS
jgi:hypothetical protein